MAEPTRDVLRTSGDETLEVFGETVILRRDPLGAALNASVIGEVVPPGIAGL
jgi:hypothetical protein